MLPLLKLKHVCKSSIIRLYTTVPLYLLNITEYLLYFLCNELSMKEFLSAVQGNEDKFFTFTGI